LTYEYLEHTADVAVRLRSKDGEELFSDATRALLSIFVDAEAGSPVRPIEKQALDLEAEDAEALLVDYLNQLIFLFDTRRFLGADVRVLELSLGKPSQLKAIVEGETFDPERLSLKTEIKAATFHGIEIRKTPSGLETVIVFDL